MFFVWTDSNKAHLLTHRVEPHEAEEVIRSAKRPYPRNVGGGAWQVKGRTSGKRMLHVIYVFRSAEDIDLDMLDPLDRIALLEGEPAVYVIHARDLRRGEF